MTDHRRTGTVAVDLADALTLQGAPQVDVCVHGDLLSADLDPATTPAQGMAVLRALHPAGAVHVLRARRHAVLLAKIGACRVRLRVRRDVA